MKRIKYLSLFAAALFCFASCDKIEEDNFVTFLGATFRWESSDVEVSNTQRAFLEKYTGVRCKNCPSADNTIHAAMVKYGDRLSVASVHCTSLANPLSQEDPDLRTDKGSTWAAFFCGANPALPTGLINRSKLGSNWALFNPSAGFDDKVDSVLNSPASIGLDMVSGKSAMGTQYDVDVFIQFFQTVSEPLTLTLLLIEDDIHTSQLDGSSKIDDYQQNHVLREIITDEWGSPLNADGSAGSKCKGNVKFDLREGCVPEKCSLVAFISYKDSREIINCVQCNLQ